MTTLRSLSPIESDLMLIFPPFQRTLVSMENIGIEYIAASARAAGFRAAMINAGLYGIGTGDIVDILDRARFRVLGISTIHWTMPSALAIAKAAKNRHPLAHIILGGLEAALDAERILLNHSFVDSVALGEGEQMIPDLLTALVEGSDWRNIPGLARRSGGSASFSPKRQLIDPLDELPFPARDDLAAVMNAGGPVAISSSRGCSACCSFCSVRAFYGLSDGLAWRGRTPESVVAEIREIKERSGARLFSFIDETVAGPGEAGRARLEELATLIAEADMGIEFFMTVRADQVEAALFRELRAAGLRKVEIGIESMAPTQLKRYGKLASVDDNRRALKILDDLGLAVEAFMIPFDPDVTPTELGANLDFLEARFANGGGYDVTPLSLGNYLYPYPGTAVRDLYVRRGWWNEGRHVPFQAGDIRMRKVKDILGRLLAANEAAFPLSIMGIGNLWVNNADLPESVRAAIGEICAEFGKVLVEAARWALSITANPLPIPIQQVAGLIRDLRRFQARLTLLRDRMRGIVRSHGNLDETGPAMEIEPVFARELFSLGMRGKRLAIEDMLGRAVDENEIITGILDSLLCEAGS